MNKQYIIRLKGYNFDGYYGSENCSVGVHSIYKKRADAEKAKLKLEQKRFIGWGLAFKQIYENEGMKNRLSDFFKGRYNFSIWSNQETNELDCPIYVPDTLSLEDTSVLIDIIGSSFFEIVEKGEQAMFYQVKIDDLAWEKIVPKDIFQQIRIFPLSTFLNEYNKGVKLFNTAQEAYCYGVYRLANYFNDKTSYLSYLEKKKNVQISRASFFYKLLNIAERSQIDEHLYEVYFASEMDEKDFHSIVKNYEIITVEEEEMWDLLYNRITQFGEEIEYFWEMGNTDLESLSLEYGIPGFFIKMMLNGELEGDI